jgi:hypothetical protein
MKQNEKLSHFSVSMSFSFGALRYPNRQCKEERQMEKETLNAGHG